jgi:hypothetical protein
MFLEEYPPPLLSFELQSPHHVIEVLDHDQEGSPPWFLEQVAGQEDGSALVGLVMAS